jgi:hypothetical protein
MTRITSADAIVRRRSRVPYRNVLFAVGILPCAHAARAQTPTAIRLDSPERVVSQSFSLLRGARELPHGRLLVTDFTEDRVAVVDFTNGTVSDRNRTGAGPEEFRLPGGLLPWTADSTLLLDGGNSRIAVLDADGRIRRIFQPSNPAATSPGGVDASGRLYFVTPAWMARTELRGDTVELAVLDPATNDVRPVARIQGVVYPSTNFSATPRIPIVVFSKTDGWGVARDGRVAIVRGGDYSVQWLSGNRVVATGPSYASRATKVTPADRMAYARRFIEGSGVSGRATDGGLQHNDASALQPAALESLIRSSEFAATLPWFRAGEVSVDADDLVWIGRMAPEGEPRQYDVFDGAGKRVATVQLAAGRRLLFAGRRSIYVVARDADGLETIERHSRPALMGH